MRRGFSLITAIIFVVLIATLGMFALSTASLTAKQTGDIYLREQAELLAQGVTEIAVLKIQQTDFTPTNCLSGKQDITAADGVDAGLLTIFDVWFDVKYIGTGLTFKPDGLPATQFACTDTLFANINTPASNRTVIIDTYVQSKETTSTEPIRVHRRTIQKP